jgi:hypothetical protein
MSLVKGLIAIMVAVIVGIGVAIPVTSQVIANASLSGTDALLVGFISTLMIVALIIGVVSLFN